MLGAVTVYVSLRGSADPEKQEEWGEARDWLFSSDEGAGSFLEACDELGFRPEKVRLLADQLDARTIEKMKSGGFRFDG